MTDRKTARFTKKQPVIINDTDQRHHGRLVDHDNATATVIVTSTPLPEIRTVDLDDLTPVPVNGPVYATIPDVRITDGLSGFDPDRVYVDSVHQLWGRRGEVWYVLDGNGNTLGSAHPLPHAANAPFIEVK